MQTLRLDSPANSRDRTPPTLGSGDSEMSCDWPLVVGQDMRLDVEQTDVSAKRAMPYSSAFAILMSDVERAEEEVSGSLVPQAWVAARCMYAPSEGGGHDSFQPRPKLKCMLYLLLFPAHQR